MNSCDTETWLKVSDAFIALQKLDDMLGFAVTVGLLTGMYILYQMFRLPFLRWFIASDLLYVALWLFDHRHAFIGYPEAPVGMERYTLLLAAGNTLSFAATALCAVGVCLGIRYLQKKWTEKEGRVDPPPPI